MFIFVDRNNWLTVPQSLATGRLATFALPFVDCELPFDPDQTMTDDGVVQPSCTFFFVHL